MIEVLHDVAEAVVQLANQIRLGHSHVLERDVRRVACPPAHRLDLLAVDAGARRLDEEQRDPLWPCLVATVRHATVKYCAVSPEQIHLRAPQIGHGAASPWTPPSPLLFFMQFPS